ncbi:hypothetical protein ACG2LH_16035 [Zhouia sp. PK063]
MSVEDFTKDYIHRSVAYLEIKYKFKMGFLSGIACGIVLSIVVYLLIRFI